MAVTDTIIIVPAFNEGSVIATTLAGPRAEFSRVICVDDGSRDDTAAQARAAGALVLRHVVNIGQGAALQTGIDYARRFPVDYFVTFDADGQHRVADVLALRQSILDQPVDIILGSRFLGQRAQIPAGRRIMLRVAVAFSNLTAGLRLTDAHNGLRLFNRHVAATIELKETGYRHASEFTEKIATNHYSYREVPVTIDYTRYSRAKGQSALNAVNLLADTFAAKALRQ